MGYWGDRPRDVTVELGNGKKAVIACNWADGPEHVVLTATVLVEEPSPGDDLVIGDIQGPLTHEEANERGAQLAERWYRNRPAE